MIGSAPILAVSEFVAVFNQSLAMTFPAVGVVGELANFRISRGQWVYLDLKDEEAQVKFFGTVRQLPGPLEDGMLLEIFGRPRLHPKFGFSINIDSIRPIGEGSIKKAQDLLARKLETEGLFALERKRPLPYAPERVGLITSQDSAACADFRKIIDARWGRVDISLIDVLVQGEQSAAQLVTAINDFNELAEPPEVLVLVRGGGSAEDLASFSDEKVVRAVAASRIPTLVAIGHETDVSLAELVADQRASTPSNAAEILVPDRRQEKSILSSWQARLKAMSTEIMRSAGKQLGDYQTSIDQLLESGIANWQRQLVHQKELLNLLDPSRPLQRGYAIARDKDRQIIRSVNQLSKNDIMYATLRDGTIKSRVE